MAIGNVIRDADRRDIRRTNPILREHPFPAPEWLAERRPGAGLATSFRSDPLQSFYASVKGFGFSGDQPNRPEGCFLEDSFDYLGYQIQAGFHLRRL